MSKSIERDPLLAKNKLVDCQRFENYGILKLQVPDTEVAASHWKVISYNNEQAHTFKALFIVTATQFRNVATWKTCASYWLMTGLVCYLTILARRYGFNHALLLQAPKQQEAFADLTKYLTAIVAFMLGLFVSHMVNRWWAMRSLVCDFFNVVHDLMSRVAVRMPDPADRKYIDRLLRFCLLSHRLIYFQAREEESEDKLRRLVNTGLLSEAELERLKDQPAKPLVVWMWINSLFRELQQSGKLQELSPPVLARFDGMFGQAAAIINRIFAYIDTQVPFPYVHTLTAMVVANNLLIAVKSGIYCGNAEGPGGYPDSCVVVLEAIHVVLIPFAYHSFLCLGFELANPFGSDVSDFPGDFFNVQLRNTELACTEAVFNPPPSTKLDPEEGTALGKV